MKKLIIFFGVLLLGASCATDLRFELPQGPAGPPGPAGKSAYELWLEGINNGTIKWDKGTDIVNFYLYMKGDEGASAYDVWKEYIATGNADDPHNPGLKWAKTRNTMDDFFVYLTGQKGANGTNMGAFEIWANSARLRDLDVIPAWLDEILTGDGELTLQHYFRYFTGAPGATGATGDKGDTGDKGADGMSAYGMWKAMVATGNCPNPNGAQGYWPIDDDSELDFLTYLTGLQGIQGIQGPQGIPGEQGPQGETGATGPQGPQGIQGEKGDKGDTGEQGIPGEKGDKGDTGEQGIPGEKGDKGDTGEQGIPGEKGDKGDTGADGISAYEVWKAIVELGNCPNPNGAPGLWPATKNTESDFLEYLTGLKGETGDTGAPGPVGPEGPKGDKGDKGDQGDDGIITEVVKGMFNAFELWAVDCDKKQLKDYDPAFPHDSTNPGKILAPQPGGYGGGQAKDFNTFIKYCVNISTWYLSVAGAGDEE